jgi:hypothetical protein
MKISRVKRKYNGETNLRRSGKGIKYISVFPSWWICAFSFR